MTTNAQWHLNGELIGACNCDWGCPCNFNARPTNGWCQGTYAWQIEDGKFGEINLTGLHFIWSGASPGPIHEGHVTAQVVIDSKANSQQREALLRLFHGKDGGPFAIFAAITEHLYVDGGHTIDFANKAFELLDHIGWQHAGPVLTKQDRRRFAGPR